MPQTYLRSGIFLAPFHALEENPTLAIERDLELVQHLDRLGYHEAWIGEHHSGGFEIIASPEVFIATAAERTRHIRLGTGVVSLPYHNPFILADRMVLLDHLTRGRAMFGVGPGALVHDAKKIGVEAADQRPMMNQSLDVIVRLLAGETVTEKTDWYDLHRRPAATPLLQPAGDGDGGRRLALAHRRAGRGTARHRHALDRRHLARRDDPARTQLVAVRGTGACPTARPPDRRNWRLVSLFHIAETRERARENVRFGIEKFAQYFRDVGTFPIVPPGDRRRLRIPARQPGRLHRHAGRRDRLYRAAAGRLGRLRRHPGAGAQLGRLAGNAAPLRADGPLRACRQFQGSREWRQDSYAFARDNSEVFRAQSQAAVQAEIDRLAAQRAAAA